jgi:hypothetical protein
VNARRAVEHGPRGSDPDGAFVGWFRAATTTTTTTTITTAAVVTTTAAITTVTSTRCEYEQATEKSLQ